jgi:hypothetical protein
MIRTKCKHCLGPPIYYSCSGGTPSFEHPRTLFKLMDAYNRVIRRFNNDFFMFLDKPSNMISINLLSNNATHSFNIKRYKSNHSKENNFVEFISCECSRSCWVFAEKSGSLRPEISNRKSTKRFPFKII